MSYSYAARRSAPSAPSEPVPAERRRTAAAPISNVRHSFERVDVVPASRPAATVIQRQPLTRAELERLRQQAANQGLNYNNTFAVNGPRESIPPNRFGAPPQVQYTSAGNQVFNPGSDEVARQRMNFSGNSMTDIARANAASGGQPANTVLHHMYMPGGNASGDLIATDPAAHGQFHYGGSAQQRALNDDDPDRLARYRLPNRQGLG